MSATIPEQQARESNDATPGGLGSLDEEARKQAIDSLRRKHRVAENAVAYVTVNGALWLIWALTDRSTDGSMPWPAWVSAVWGFFLAMDAWRTFGAWPRSLHRPITEADIERELTRLRRS